MSASENLLAFDLGMIGGMTGRVWGGAAMEARNMFGAPGGSVCFVAGTQVAVAGDSSTITGKAIEDIKLGDWVWSRNDETGEEGYKPVVHLFRNTTEELAHLTYTSGTGLPTREGTLTGTPGHKFWSETRQAWTPMGKLQPGEKLKLADGSTATVSACTVEHLTQPVAIYNFEVADWHTYHVGGASSGWVWVHNRNCSYDSTAKRWRDLETGQFVKAPPHNKVLRPDAQATLYQKVGAKGEHRKWGMTFHKDPRLRYTAAEIGKGGDVLPVRRSQRRSIAAQERRLVETDPGPENHEPWAGWRKPGHPNYRGK